MSKTKKDKRKSEAVDPQVKGPSEQDNPVGSAPDSEEAGTNSDDTQTGDKASEGQVAQPPEAESDADDGSGSAQDPQRKPKVSPFGDPPSEGEQKATAKADKPLADSKEAHKPVVKLQSSPSPTPAQGNKGLSADKELSEERIDELVHKVIENRNKADDTSLGTGKMLLAEVFGGNLDEAFSRNPKKKESFTKICDHPDMDVDATTLSRWVKAANLVKTFEQAGKKFKNLTCSHYIALLALKKSEITIRLAEEAEKNKFSVRRLALEVDRAEPPALKSLLATISSKLTNPTELKKVEKDLLDKKKWAKLEPKDRDTLIIRVKNAKIGAQTFINQLARFGKLLEEIAEEAK